MTSKTEEMERKRKAGDDKMEQDEGNKDKEPAAGHEDTEEVGMARSVGGRCKQGGKE